MRVSRPGLRPASQPPSSRALVRPGRSPLTEVIPGRAHLAASLSDDHRQSKSDRDSHQLAPGLVVFAVPGRLCSGHGHPGDVTLWQPNWSEVLLKANDSLRGSSIMAGLRPGHAFRAVVSLRLGDDDACESMRQPKKTALDHVERGGRERPQCLPIQDELLPGFRIPPAGFHCLFSFP